MRVNLLTWPEGAFQSEAASIPLSLTIRPACGLPGDYHCPTDSASLLRLLRQKTDLPGPVIDRFEKNMRGPLGARLLGVELSDKVLTDVGYFID